MAFRDFLAVPLVLLGTTVATYANGDAAWGRMICEVVASRIVPADDTHTEVMSRLTGNYPVGTEFNFDYGLDDASALTIYFRETSRPNALINETFSASNFRGLSPVSNMAEFGATYSGASFGRYWLHYKGNDQLFIKNRCDEKEWSGHFVQTHVSGLFTQVVSLECRHFVDAHEEVYARLAGMK